MAAPSAKNRQPWKFIVVTEQEKPAMLNAIREGLEQEKAGTGLFSIPPAFLAGAEYTLQVMEQAPVTVFVFNTEQHILQADANITGKLIDSTNVQSVGAAIQNMLLAATALGIGSLWICDVFFAYNALCGWLGETNQMIAAVSFGYADESPAARPRKAPEDVIVFK